LIHQLRFNSAKFICNFLPPIISQRIRHFIYPRKLALSNPIKFNTKSVTGSYLQSDTEEYHGYSFGIHGYYEWRLLAIALLGRELTGSIVEIGANIGTETIGFADIMRSRGNVYAFEPLTTHFKSLTKLFSNKYNSHVTVHPHALGDKKCKLQFVIPKDKFNSGAGHIIGKEKNIQSESINVTCETLDNMANTFRNVSLIFMDAEGSELNILIGGSKLIIRDKPIIILEASDQLLNRYNQRIDDLILKIETLNYTPYKISRFCLAPYTYEDKKRKANLVCIPVDKHHLVKKINLNIKLSGFLPMVKNINPLKQY